MGICLKYIKQCEKAVEVQKAWKPAWGDRYYTPSNPDRPGHGFWGLCIDMGRNYFGYIRTPNIWLPLQHQLQAMVAGEYMLHDFIGWYNPDNRCIHADREDGFYAPIPCEDCRNKRIDIHKTFTSMEQLWLGFVMEQLYQKRWDGSDWVAMQAEKGV